MSDIDAIRAAGEWAAKHLHQQPDDRMLRAYGRALLAGLADELSTLARQRRYEAQPYAGMSPPHPTGVEARIEAQAYEKVANALTTALGGGDATC